MISRGPRASVNRPMGIPMAYMPRFPAAPCQAVNIGIGIHQLPHNSRSSCSQSTRVSSDARTAAPTLNMHTIQSECQPSYPEMPRSRGSHTFVPQHRAIRVPATTEMTRAVVWRVPAMVVVLELSPCLLKPSPNGDVATRCAIEPRVLSEQSVAQDLGR